MTTKAWQEKWPVKVAASLTVHEIPNMTAKGRKAICRWLRRLADDLEDEPEAFAQTFRARYLYPAPKAGKEK